MADATMSTSARSYEGPGTCAEPSFISSAMLEPFIERVYFALVTARRPHGQTAKLDALAGRAKEQADAAERALVAYRDDGRMRQTLGADRYHAGLVSRVERAEHAWIALSEVNAAQSVDANRLPANRAEWQSASLEQRRGPHRRGYCNACSSLAAMMPCNASRPSCAVTFGSRSAVRTPTAKPPFRATAAQRALSERAGLPARLWSERRLTAELKIFTRDVRAVAAVRRLPRRWPV